MYCNVSPPIPSPSPLHCSLHSPPIRRGERLPLGAPGYYISWKAAPGAAEEEALQLMRLEPIACKLAAVHREAGQDAYFTISMDHTGDLQIAHELQVEWPKYVSLYTFIGWKLF
jgi:hypothetical protein